MKKNMLLGGIIAGFLLLSASCKTDNPEVIVEDEPEGKPDGSFTLDGRDYFYRTIGTQTWMTENLAWLPAVSPYKEGSNDVAYYYVYGYKDSVVTAAKATENYKTYGVLYNFEAAKTACPAGWHLPTDEEWKILEKYLGMNPEVVDYQGMRNSQNEGRKMKSKSGWENEGGGSNSSGFNALPAGYRYKYEGCVYLGFYTSFWSATEEDSSNAWYRNLGYNDESVARGVIERWNGYSVRCVKDK